jgi:WD40 repeat protein
VDFADFDLPGLPSSRRSTPATTSSSNIVHDSNVFTQGTALIGAHSKEVTSLAWTNEGNLVSISDDFTARCWREDPARARDLRVDGEKSGGRWRSGWADVGAAWDEEEG